MKSTSSLWVSALWQAAMPVEHDEIESSKTSKATAVNNDQVVQQRSQPIIPA